VDAIVTVTASGVASGIGVYVGTKLGQQPLPSDPPSPATPTIELPPGVDKGGYWCPR
jgi:hypothetical protein